jgi:hypothetical protein
LNEAEVSVLFPSVQLVFSNSDFCSQSVSRCVPTSL